MDQRYQEARANVIAGAYNDAYRGWEYRVPTEGFEAVRKDALAFAERVIDAFEAEVIRAQKEKAPEQ